MKNCVCLKIYGARAINNRNLNESCAAQIDFASTNNLAIVLFVL